jgi:formylglycine-generating enzyme required for sulfatase activity
MEYAWGNEPPPAIAYFTGEWNAPRPVAQWLPNGYGLFNMGDNVHEWCMDWYAPGYYSVSPDRNPPGPEEGTRRVSRGGSWRHQIKGSRAAHRSSLPPDFRYTDYGFRIVRDDT